MADEPDDSEPTPERQAQHWAMCPHPEAVGTRWGDPIGVERQAELMDLADHQRAWADAPDHRGQESAFKGVRLTGADVFWLAAYAMAGPRGDVAAAQERLRSTHIDISSRLLTGFASTLHLEGADLYEAHLEGAGLGEAHLEGAWLIGTYLNWAWLIRAHLQGADLGSAHLERTLLNGAHLDGANLAQAHLKGAGLIGAHLERADLSRVHVEGAVLTNAYLDDATNLSDVILSDSASELARIACFILRRRLYGSVSLADVHWNGVDLTAVDWSGLTKLGDERGLRRWWRSRKEQERAARANVQLAKQLDNAGLKDDRDRFSYRSQVCQRGVHLLRFHLLRWLFSWLLYIVAGYGYRPLRTLFWYMAVITGFAFAYFQATHGALTFGLPPSQVQPLSWYEALVLSVSSFHGRGFFQPVQSLGDPVAILAAAEAVFGLFIEVSFIATFTQRYFGK